MNTSIGLSKFYQADYAENGGTVSYSNGSLFGMATQLDIVTEGKSPAILYADNGPAESVALFGGGTATLGVHKLTLAQLANFLGQGYVSSTGCEFKADVGAPYKGIGGISMDISGGTITYSAIVLYKVQCKTPDITRVTRGESVEYQVPNLEFMILRDDTSDAKWMWMQDGYATEALAEAALKAKLGIS